MKSEEKEFPEMLGVTMVSCEHDTTIDELVFTDTEGNTYRFFHEQQCCEEVSIEDICGDLDDLVGSPILIAESYTQDDDNEDQSRKWTFYTYRTNKGTVTVRWYGRSNGYYSESVDFEFVKAS